MNSGKPGVMFYFDVLPALEKLPAEKVGTLFLAAMRYGQSGELPAFDDVVLDFAWALMKPSIDRDSARYKDKRTRGDWLTYCRQCKQAGIAPMDFATYRQRVDNGTLQSETSTLPTTTPTTTPTSTTTPTPTSISTNKGIGAATPPTHTRFCPPSVEEVRAYCLERKNQVDPERFFDFYTSKNWMIGKNKMKDWKASIRLWERGENHGSLSSSSVDRGKVESRWGTIQSVQLD